MLRFPICILVLDLVTYARSLDRIVGGYEANITDFPYHLSVRKDDKFLCGGALIGPKYGLSAAHCFGKPGLYTVRAGSSLRNFGGVLNVVITVFIHPEYASHELDYDIAIMKFKKRFRFSQTIQPIKLPDKYDKINPGVAGVVSGFGRISNNEELSKVLRGAAIFIDDPDLCQNSYKHIGITISHRVICAWVQGEKDACQGDSGSSFAINGVLYGIVSVGKNCGDPYYPGLYTNVTSFLEFIRLNTEP